jgi:hypothetical protein
MQKEVWQSPLPGGLNEGAGPGQPARFYFFENPGARDRAR